MTNKPIQIHHSDGEWSGLYVDGKLEYVGDTSNVYDKLCEMFGIEQEYDNAFMRGQDKRDGVAKTVEEAEEYKRQRDKMRERRAALLAEADALERRYGR